MDQAKLLARTCIHFVGLGPHLCRAGLPTPLTKPRPCLGEAPCSSYQAPSPEEVEAELASIAKAVRAVEKAVSGTECPSCGKDPKPTRQVGRCVYGACGHRLYQGKR